MKSAFTHWANLEAARELQLCLLVVTSSGSSYGMAIGRARPLYILIELGICDS